MHAIRPTLRRAGTAAALWALMAIPAGAQGGSSLNAAFEDCAQPTAPERGYEACSELIASDTLSGRTLATAHLNRGIWLGRLGRWLEAILEFNRSIEIDQGYAPPWINRAAARATLGNLEDALSDADEALALDPGMVDGYVTRARIHRSLGDAGAAEADLLEAVQIGGRPRVLWFQSRMAEIGIYDGSLTGTLDDATAAAIARCATHPRC